ncbi:MAG: hypothetical protein ABSC23_14590 [Bryobacteraceae bacterium]|jgi:hypothetical protein
MNARLSSRLNRLEKLPGLCPSCAYRIGLLKRLLEDYVGERHIVIVEKEGTSSSDTGWCEFEERPGPPPGSDDGIPRVYVSEDEMNF